jgi:hypothetical protein
MGGKKYAYEDWAIHSLDVATVAVLFLAGSAA